LSLLNSQKKDLLNIKNALLDKAKFKDANLNFIDSQVREIQNAKLKTEDFEALKNLDSIKEKIKNKQQYQEIFDMFYSEEGILSLISKLKRKFNNLTVEEKELKNLEQLVSSSNDLSEFFNSMLSSVEEIQISEERISQIKKIQQRYGSDFNAVKEKLAILKKEYQQLNDIDAELATLDKGINKLDKECLIICERISLIRKNNSKKLEKLISSHLQSLEMKGSSFEILFETIPMSNSGFDKITFTLSSNKGQKNRPINEIASGGELSRLTLAIYLSSDKLHHNFLVFDEIDAGVGGSTAFSIGAKLKDLSSKQQVLCITHLAQIAAYNNQIIKVTKESTKKDTITQIVNITEKNEILLEISRMLGDSSKKGLELAEELVNKVN
jgi:DNA repair protein RecN (Recombination protein N)